MILDVKIPRWAAVIVAGLWTLNLVLGIAAMSVSIAANVKYLGTERLDPPPPWPGEPALDKPQEPKKRKRFMKE